jgi:hypothetical protein
MKNGSSNNSIGLDGGAVALVLVVEDFGMLNDSKMHSHDVVDSTTSTAAGTISSHPILQGLRELHDFLSVVESGSTFC